MNDTGYIDEIYSLQDKYRVSDVKCHAEWQSVIFSTCLGTGLKAEGVDC